MSSIFHFRRIASDREGYYYDRWDRAIPVTVTADTEAEAYRQLWTISGEAPRGRFWKAKLDRVTAAKECGCDA